MTTAGTGRPAGQLFVVATPIGNLQDLSPRAVETLQAVARIACEDTRHTGRLLSHFGISTPTISYHEHNEKERTPQLIEWLLQGDSIALVSDAGTRLVSDPGYRLVRAARQAGLSVSPVPGPSAAVAALSVSGLPSDQFLFLGFPPGKDAAFETTLESLRGSTATLVWYLSPHRLLRQLELLQKVFGEREAFLIREMTKLHEESFWGPLPEIREALGDATLKGEFTLVVTGAHAEGGAARAAIDVQAYLEGLMKLRGLSRSAAAGQAAKELGLSKRDLYKESLE